MKSFSSSVINKSGKKFAPKAPARRAPAPPPPRRPSVASQPSASQTPQPATATATPEPGPSTTSVQSTAAAHTVPVETPAAAPKKKTTPSLSATAIAIPQPKRKPSVSAAPPGVAEVVPPPPQPTPPSTAPTELASQSSINEPLETRADGSRDVSPTHVVERCAEEAAAPQIRARRPADGAIEIRPTKRPRTNSAAQTPIPPLTASTEPPATQVPPLPTPPASQANAIDTQEPSESQTETESQTPAPTTQPRKVVKVRRKSVKEGNGENATAKKKERKTRTRRRREPTPEGSENVEIAPGLIKMSELCKDLRTGKLSKRETELRVLDQAEQERKQRAQQEGDTEVPVKANGTEATPAVEGNSMLDNKSQAGPVMRIVNGEIVLDTASLQVDRHADAARNAGALEDVVENTLTRKINQSTYGKRSKTESWDEEMTDLFYRGLRIFGTDFMMISKLFPGRSRRQIKLKFNNEERRDPLRIKDTLLGPRESIDISTYSQMTNTVYDDPKVIQQQLDDERKQMEEQHAKEKEAQEELLRNPDGAAEGSGQNGDMPSKVKRLSRRQAMKAMAGGTEEVLGTIDDVP
ncbi:transcription factor IIIB, Bdp1 subunit [Aspergillus japonicus CBS 114.51]|uniref:Transcription factor IIIB, Bdp1 subunit n=2 Tax=Aspergillus TaxID=5052 RepID=A0A2V5I403_ASPV1|nr:transcription factor IIIB, Bdp1 subunit [Aspergillus japonicus CBS 114.51]PYI23230.1 transcription factor IIIB, Bdp1 subunit [Aspergillus violaceofuscus CBS 115571]RAH80217.1 transcription factor IIIB, Bdp1 subunit [Aspergillus japonicus CBS 114.51]